MPKKPKAPAPLPKSAVAMRITEKRKKDIAKLAAGLADIAPATSPGNSFCVQQVAEQQGLKNCWKAGRNKRETIQALLENTLRRYPRKPKKLVLAIVEGGIQRQARQGVTVSDEQFLAVTEPMEALGFNIDREVKQFPIPEPSRVMSPSQELVSLFDRLDLHPALKDDVAEMLRDGHCNEAVRKALERFEKLVQNILGDTHTHGRDLMAKVFNEKSPVVPLNDMQSQNDQNEQEGFKFLTMGAMSGMRNLYSHGDVPQMTPMDAVERLAFVSMLFKRVDAALGK